MFFAQDDVWNSTWCASNTLHSIALSRRLRQERFFPCHNKSNIINGLKVCFLELLSSSTSQRPHIDQIPYLGHTHDQKAATMRGKEGDNEGRKSRARGKCYSRQTVLRMKRAPNNPQMWRLAGRFGAPSENYGHRGLDYHSARVASSTKITKMSLCWSGWYDDSARVVA